jgi:hypothetical protein
MDGRGRSANQAHRIVGSVERLEPMPREAIGRQTTRRCRPRSTSGSLCGGAGDERHRLSVSTFLGSSANATEGQDSGHAEGASSLGHKAISRG